MPPHILIVDDDATIRRVLSLIFQKAGYQTTEAINGLEALQRLRTQPFDLITMDMAMAQMDGVDAISIIQNEIPTPIVVISAQLSGEVKKDLKARQIVYYLDKPFSANQVLEMVSTALKNPST